MKKAQNRKSVRLPNHILPIRYDLSLKPDLESFTFEGREVIQIKINKLTKDITLHSKDIKIHTAQITHNKKSEFAKISYQEKIETIKLSFKNNIPKGEADLAIVFEGVINDKLRGFYKSTYNIDGKTKHIATTQFEATDARRAFPCFDEPAQKAIFDVSLIIPGEKTAISNTLPISIKEHEGGYKVVKFSPTPIMSTYLLAFIVGDFEYIEGWTKGKKVKVRVFTTKGKTHQAKFALDVAIKSLEFYNEYFDIPYPLDTLDLIAIPDFESAAMENWGAVTFRETALLVDEEHTSLSNKQWVAIVIAHEIAHQWFGNLVTMHWWTDLWLNEGFASYMENLCVDKMFPSWHIWDLYLADRYAVALRLDSLANSHPIEVEVHHPSEISEIFDMVSYAKGSAVIRMVAEYIGYEKFRDGLRYYLKKHSYNNTNTVDLWNAFEKVSGKPINKMMETWTKKTGYPILSVSSKNNIFEVKQERFFLSRISSTKNKEKTVWDIPLKYKLEKDSKSILFKKKNIKIKAKTLGKINEGEGSFVRTSYDKEALGTLGKQILSGKMPVKDRLGLARDIFAIAEAGYIKTEEALKFSLYYKNEEEYIVWSELASGINRLYRLINNENFVDKYKTYALSLFSPLAEKMGFNNKNKEGHSAPFLRNLAISNAGAYGDKNIIKKSQEIFKNRKRNPIRADMRSTIYGIIASNGSKKEWEMFVKMYSNESFHEEKERLGYALTRLKDKKLLEKTLNFALSKNVRNQDTPFMIAQVWQNPVGRDIAWKFVKKNWKEILKNYGEGGFISRLLSPLEGHKITKDLVDIKKFFNKNIAPGAERTLEQVYERINSNIAWLKADKNSIKNWLDKNY